METSFTFEDIAEAPKLKPSQSNHYNTAIKLALVRETEADNFDAPLEGIGPSVNGKYPELELPNPVSSNYWEGFIEGLNARIQFNLNLNVIEDRMVTEILAKSEGLKGIIAGYMLYELRSMIPNDYDPPQVNGLDCSPIKWAELLPKFQPQNSI